MAREGKRDLLIAPIGFISEHVEVLYDIDVGVRQIADRHGARIERTPMLNDSETLIDVLVTLYQSAVQEVRSVHAASEPPHTCLTVTKD